MTFYHEPPADEYGEAKLTILKMLWEGKLILGDDILATVKQAYYDRRIRELRDEDGWEIETTWAKNIEGKLRPAYRLKSHIRGKGFPRAHISKQDRVYILERDQHTCQLDGADLSEGRNNPQIDHKVPLIRDGKNERSNYQAICSNCNILKRGMCRMCSLSSCNNCYLAYPEKGSNNLFINLTEQESIHLSKVAQALDISRIEALKKIVRANLGD